MAATAQAALSTAVSSDRLDAVAIGSPHLSLAEFDALERLIAGRKLAFPLYACTGRHALAELDRDGRRKALEGRASSSLPTPASSSRRSCPTRLTPC